ncbi:hypothetical protein MRB53_037437 [Persea americana]|nr:hypothetical protein MRB53_037437 [Persea americana]
MQPARKRTSGLVHSTPLHHRTAKASVKRHNSDLRRSAQSTIYMMRHFFAYEPRRLLCSDGQQTLGIGMPWAIAASLTQDPPCSQKVVSMSGDGGFMFSVQELSTAVQQAVVSSLEVVDFAKLAEAFGGNGFRVNDSSELEKVMDEALAHKGVSLVDVRIDYSHAGDLAKNLIKDSVG